MTLKTLTAVLIAITACLAAAAADATIWTIGQTDNSADEFSSRASRTVQYDIGAGATAKDWPTKQGAGERYTIHFPLTPAPSDNYRLTIRGFFLDARPEAMLVAINGHQGSYRLVPERGDDSDFRQGGNFLYSVCRVEVPVPAALLQAGPNTIELTVADRQGGTLNYDSVTFAKAPGAVAAPGVVLAPTIFFRRTPHGLVEVTHIVITHATRLGPAAITLQLPNGTSLETTLADDDTEFGESVATVEVPADVPAGACRVTVRAKGSESAFPCEFKPEKQWKLYAGLKVHNDLGYTNLQKSVQAAHERNTDLILKALREHPAHKFNLENSWLADTYTTSRTAPLRDELLRRAQEQRLGVGALYLNLLTGLCSAEELCRAMYYAASLQREHGIAIRSAALTDTPSQSWGLASLLADAGLSGFALGSNQHRGPLLMNSNLNETSPFYWEGADGRRILTFVGRAYHQVGRMADGKSLPALAKNMEQALARYRRPDYPFDAMYLLGYVGDNADVRDAGAGVIERWNAAYAFPQLIPCTDAEYFDYIAAKYGSQLPVRRGDMGSYWADAAGALARATIKNREAQRMLPRAEMVASWASLLAPEIAYPVSDFRGAWNEVLFYDEHSWGANNSTTQPGQRFGAEQIAFKEAHVARATEAAQDLLQLSFARIVENIPGDGAALMVFNPSAHPHAGMIEVEIDANQQIVDLVTDKLVPIDVVSEHAPQDVGNGLSHWYTGLVRPWRTVRFLAENVPALGYRSYEIRRVDDPTPAANKPAADAWRMEQRYYRVTLDPATGAIQSIWDKELGRELVDPKAAHQLNGLVYAAGGEGQTIINNLHHWAPTQLDVTGQGEARLVEHVRTPLGERIRIQASARNVPLIESEITIYDHLKRIDISNRIRKDDILKKEAIYFAFPFAVTPPQLRYQSQNGWVDPTRDLLPGACVDCFTTQDVVVAADAGCAVVLATPDLPLVTLGDINRGTWAKQFVARNGHVFSYVTNNYWDTNIPASQGGELSFRYYLTSLSSLDYDRVADFDAEVRAAPLAYHVRRWQKGAKATKTTLQQAQGEFLSVNAPDVQVLTFKQAEDGNGYILRLLETSGRSGTARVSSKVFSILGASRTDVVERDLTPLEIAANAVAVPLQPHRYATVRLKLAVREAIKDPAGLPK